MALQTVNFTTVGAQTWTVPTRAYIISAFLVGGGGGGGYNGGGGGAGGRVTYSTNYLVTPGASVAVIVATGGSAGSSGGAGGTGGTSQFGALTAAGGTGGANNGGSGGNTSSSYLGITSNYTGGAGNGDSGAGGASPAQNGNASLGNGAIGYSWNGTFYGGGGGGGCGSFTETTVRPINGAYGGSGGGNGGGEGQTGSAGASNTGAGGGGGGHSGTSTTRGSFSNNNGSPVAPYLPVAASNGGNGGTGFIQIQYNEAEATLSVSNPGVAEGNSVVVYLTTRNIPNGTVLNYTLSGAGVTPSDFNPSSLTGSFTVVSTDSGISGTASKTITIATDAGVTEGTKTVTVALDNGIASTTFKIGDLYQSAIPAAVDQSGYLVVGRSYTIISANNTDFTALGSANNTTGTTFTATGSGMFFAGTFVPGTSYTIANAGNTDFIRIGAANNNIGTTFTATNSGFVQASTCVSGQRYTIMTLGNTDYTMFGAGWQGAGSFQVGATYMIKETGSTDFTTIGADNNNVGTIFVARGGGLGTGYAIPYGYTVTTGSSFVARAAGSGTGTVMPAIGTYAGSAIGWASQGTGTVVGTWIPKTIQIADYNDIQTKVATVLGTGSINSGYGQTVLSSQLSVSSRVTVTDWNNLRYDIINSYIHQVGVTPSLITPAVGETVKANVQTAPYSQYQSWADVVQVQKFDVGAGQYITRSTPSTGVGTWYAETAWPGALGSTWTSRIYSLVSVSWANANQARYFFNSGGEIRFRSARTDTGSGGAYPAQNQSWTTLLTASGTQGFGGNKPEQDTGSMSGGNFYRLTNAFQIWYQNQATNPYSANYYRIYARTPGVTANNLGTATSIEFQIEWLDAHVGIGGAGEGVDGTFSLWVSTLEASGTMVGGAGTFAVTSPTIAITLSPTT